MTDRRYITRHEYQGTRGWIARPPLSRTKLFSFNSHGGVRASLAAAQAWRDAVLASNARAARRRGPRKRMLPGYGYVRRGTVNGRDVFVAWLLLDAKGAVAATSFSVTVHGVAGAEQQCKQYLRRKRREHGLPRIEVLR
jgi:hypothetical protein